MAKSSKSGDLRKLPPLSPAMLRAMALSKSLSKPVVAVPSRA